MNERKLSRKERLCVGECIHKHWSHSSANTEDESRNQKYEQCLTSCNIRG